MSTLKANIIDSAVSTEFKKSITANGASQWLDRFGIIKANSTEIDENVTIPSGTNGLSVGTIRVGAGYSVTVQGNWRIV